MHVLGVAESEHRHLLALDDVQHQRVTFCNAVGCAGGRQVQGVLVHRGGLGHGAQGVIGGLAELGGGHFGLSAGDQKAHHVLHIAVICKVELRYQDVVAGRGSTVGVQGVGGVLAGGNAGIRHAVVGVIAGKVGHAALSGGHAGGCGQGSARLHLHSHGDDVAAFFGGVHFHNALIVIQAIHKGLGEHAVLAAGEGDGVGLFFVIGKHAGGGEGGQKAQSQQHRRQAFHKSAAHAPLTPLSLFSSWTPR